MSIPEPEKCVESVEAVTELELILNLTSSNLQVSRIETINGKMDVAPVCIENSLTNKS